MNGSYLNVVSFNCASLTWSGQNSETEGRALGKAAPSFLLFVVIEIGHDLFVAATGFHATGSSNRFESHLVFMPVTLRRNSPKINRIPFAGNHELHLDGRRSISRLEGSET